MMMKKLVLTCATALSVTACVVTEGIPAIMVENDRPAYSPVIIVKSDSLSREEGRVKMFRVNGQCLDIHGDNDRYLIRHSCHGKSNQLFQWHSDQTLRHNGRCFDIKGNDSRAGTDIILYECTGRANQKWYRDGRRIRSPMNGLCLDAGEPYIKMQTCQNTAAQYFD